MSSEAEKKDPAKPVAELRQASVELILTEEGVGGDITAFDAAGQPTPVPAKIVIKPYFYGPTDSPVLACSRVLNKDGKPLSKGAIRLSGRTGRVAMSDRTKQTTPAFLE